MGKKTTYLVTELDRLVRENGTSEPSCPECKGKVEITPDNAIICWAHGSDHYRWEMPVDPPTTSLGSLLP